jgi:hypothetical protein
LVAAPSVHGAVAGVGIEFAEVAAEGGVGIAEKGNAGLEAEESGEVAAFEGELDDAVSGHGVSDGGVAGVEFVGSGRNLDGGESAREFESDDKIAGCPDG